MNDLNVCSICESEYYENCDVCESIENVDFDEEEEEK